MNEPQPTVYVVDDDASVRKAMERLLRSAGLNVETFSSAQQYLDGFAPTAPGCLLLDLAMPGISGLDLQDTLATRGGSPAIVFLTGRAEVSDGIQAMKRGAAEFLTKPVDERVLIEAVRLALEKDRVERLQRDWITEIEHRLATLTPRELEVLRYVIAGKLNKQIAGFLGTVEKTIKVHRARAMEKMQAQSLAQLVQLAAAVGITGALPKRDASAPT